MTIRSTDRSADAAGPVEARRLSLPLVAASVTVVLWASAFVGIRAAGRDYSPGALALGRMLVGSLALTVIVGVQALRRGRWPRLPRGRALVGVLVWGVAWFGLYNLALNTAERHLDAGTTALLVNLGPVLIAVLAGLLLGEGFPARLMIGLAVAFGGVVLIGVTTHTGQGDLVGVLMALAAAGLYAGSAVGQKRLLAELDALTLTWLGAVTGAVVCLPFGRDLVQQVATAPLSSTLAVAVPRGVSHRHRFPGVGLRPVPHDRRPSGGIHLRGARPGGADVLAPAGRGPRRAGHPRRRPLPDRGRRRHPETARINGPVEAQMGDSLHSGPKTAELILGGREVLPGFRLHHRRRERR